MKRKIIQIAVWPESSSNDDNIVCNIDGSLVVLCDDGTVWLKYKGWREIDTSGIPDIVELEPPYTEDECETALNIMLK